MNKVGPFWTTEVVSAVRENWVAGVCIAQIGALFQTTEAAIRGIARRNKFPRHPQGWKLTPEEKAERRRTRAREYSARRRARAETDPAAREAYRVKARRSYERRKARMDADPLYRAHRQAVVELWRMKNAGELREKARERDRHRIRKPRGPRPRHDPKRRGGPPLMPYVPKLEPVPDTVKTFLELGKDDCRWVIGEPDGINTRYCGANMVACSYCAKHYRMAYEPTNSPVRYYRPGRAA